jgi:hypothetical protein
MRLRTINKWLRRVGLLLVVTTSTDPCDHGAISFRVMLARNYLKTNA